MNGFRLASLPHEAHCPFGAMGAERERGDGCACITGEIVGLVGAELAEVKTFRQIRTLCKESLADDLADCEARDFASAVLRLLDATPEAEVESPRAAIERVRELCSGRDLWQDSTGVRMVEVRDVLAALDGEASCRRDR